MVDQRAFLDTILAWPDDDAPRLVFADYLDERGLHDRAHFIRLQCRLASMDASSPGYADAKREEGELLLAHQVEWWRELPQARGVDWESFERGFISTVRFADWDAFRDNVEAVIAATPVLHAWFNGIDAGQAAKIMESPHLRHLIGLDFENTCRLGNAGAEALGACPHLGRLRSLNLRSNGLGPAGVRAIADSPHLRSLEDLTLDWNDIYADGAAALRCDKEPKPWRKLSLGWTRVGDDGVRRLCGSGSLGRLRFLYLASNGLSDDAAIALGACDSLQSLEALYADQNGIGDRGAAALATSPSLTRLRWMHLRHNRIGDEGGRALAESPHLGGIEELQLSENQIASAAARRDLAVRFGDRVRV